MIQQVVVRRREIVEQRPGDESFATILKSQRTQAAADGDPCEEGKEDEVASGHEAMR